GTSRSTAPSPPASHAHPVRTRRRDNVPLTAASIVSPPSVVEPALTRRQRRATADEVGAPGPILKVLLPGDSHRRERAALEGGTRDRPAEAEDEPDALTVREERRLGERVAVDDEQIGELARLERPDLPGETEREGAPGGRGGERLGRREP